MLNKTFGNLTVISEQIKVHNGKRYRVFRDCVCSCGTETRVREDNLKSGNTEHCGCMQAIPSTVQKNLNNRIAKLENENKAMKEYIKNGIEFGYIDDREKEYEQFV